VRTHDLSATGPHYDSNALRILQNDRAGLQVCISFAVGHVAQDNGHGMAAFPLGFSIGAQQGNRLPSCLERRPEWSAGH
jgi:hypothetical protein